MIGRVDAACRAAGVGYIPVLPADPAAGDVLAARVAAGFHAGGVVVRVMSPLGVSTLADLAQALATVRSLGLRPVQADVVCDCGFIPDTGAAAGAAGALIVQLARALTQGWRSVTALAGAVPATLAKVEPAGRVRVGRHDAAMFRQLAFAVDFGDFGLASPQQAPLDSTPAAAALWWNTGDNWVGYPMVGLSDSDLYRRVADDGFLRGAESAGSAEVAHRAGGDGVVSAATSDVLRWATSHHVATVIRRLSRGAA